MATAKEDSREILIAPYIILFLASKQRETLGSPPKKEVRHPSTDLTQSYVEEVTPPWYPQIMETAISKGPHA